MSLVIKRFGSSGYQATINYVAIYGHSTGCALILKIQLCDLLTAGLSFALVHPHYTNVLWKIETIIPIRLS